MSEYQYLEFRAIDRPLAAEQQSAMRRISHRVELTPERASFTFTAGSFNAEPALVLAQHFDALIHLTGWGDKRLMFRFPAPLLDLEAVKAYGNLAGRVTWSTRGDCALLDIHFPRDPGAGWVEAERWLPSLLRLRTDLLRGDYRVLYLAWLKSLVPEDVEDAVEEPPVPAGLRDLSPELEAFLELFEIDPSLLDVAAEASGELAGPAAGSSGSPPFGMSESDVRRAVEALPRYEADAYLLRVVSGEPLADIALLRRLRELGGVQAALQSPRRTTGQLLAVAAEARREQQAQAMRAARSRHSAELEDLAAREEQAWGMVQRLISRRSARAYDEAVDLLLKLRDAAVYKDREEAFQKRLDDLCEQAKGRRGLAGRLRAAQLCH
jgi:hypothetical protein